jgi:predicted RNA-binding Zn-ribbon protein involved in translation (DUF1610 family)
MSQIEDLPCPSCGAVVATVGGPEYRIRVITPDESHDTAYNSERRSCPSCGAALERVVASGAAWRLAPLGRT